jgi:AcrR family transcriptional regulator
VLRRAYSDFADDLERRIRGQSGTNVMRQLGLGYLGYAKSRPLQYQLMFAIPLPTPEAHPEMMAEARRVFGILCDPLAALPNRAGRDVAPDALFVWSTMHGLASIMKTCLGNEMGLTDAAIPRTSRHMLDMIGKALGAPIA